jgi:hypothetical protein
MLSALHLLLQCLIAQFPIAYLLNVMLLPKCLNDQFLNPASFHCPMAIYALLLVDSSILYCASCLILIVISII